MLANSLIELDRAHLIHPVSSYRGHEALGVRVLKSAKGATVTDASGRQLVDGFAGLWCVNVGYGQRQRRAGRGRADARAALCHRLFPLRLASPPSGSPRSWPSSRPAT